MSCSECGQDITGNSIVAKRWKENPKEKEEFYKNLEIAGKKLSDKFEAERKIFDKELNKDNLSKRTITITLDLEVSDNLCANCHWIDEWLNCKLDFNPEKREDGNLIRPIECKESEK